MRLPLAAGDSHICDSAMDLKLSRLNHDSISKQTVVEFIDVLDPYPVVTISARVITQPDQTAAQIEDRIKAHAKVVLEAAMARCR